MARPSSMDLPAGRHQLEHADVDLLRQIVVDFANAPISPDVDAVCGADYGAVTERVNRPQRLSHP